MSWMEWITASHSLLINLPVGIAIVLPWALVAAQRPGRGIRPWWVTCRYLGGAGLLSSLIAIASAYLHAREMGWLSTGSLLIARSAWPQLWLYQACLLGSLPLNLLYLKVALRRREEYQGFGILPLLLGLLWCACLLTGSWFGNHFYARQKNPIIVQTPVAEPKPNTPAPVAEAVGDPEAKLPLRLLDYQALEPMQAEPVKSAPHANRWVRVWVNKEGAEAYRTGGPLPVGSFVAMSTLEDRWGRPGPEAGPLFGLEILPGGKSTFTYYWAKVSDNRLVETKGEKRAYWRRENPNLQSCLTCHAQGLAPMAQRSKGFKKKAAPEASLLD